MKTLKFDLLVCIVVLISSCGSKPSDSQLQKDFENSVEAKYPRYMKGISCTKTNGIENEDGQGSYTVMFEGEILGINNFVSVGFGIKDGEKIRVKGKMMYKKSEKGWIVSKFDFEKI